MDPAPGFQTLVNHFPGLIVDMGGAQDNNVKVNIRIRHIKELCRSVKKSLPWKLQKTLVKDLVAYAATRKNILHTTAINLNVCPKVLFTESTLIMRRKLGWNLEHMQRYTMEPIILLTVAQFLVLRYTRVAMQLDRGSS